MPVPPNKRKLKEIDASLLLFTPEVCLEDLSLQRYSVLPFEPLHDLKGYLGAILRKLPSVIPNGPLKDSVAAYLDSIWKKEHLYGSDLREALIEVAHLFETSTKETQELVFMLMVSQNTLVLFSQRSG